VVFSHAHIDHIGGVVDANGRVLFPNAQFYIAQSDYDFWTDEGKLGSPLKDFVGSRAQEPAADPRPAGVFQGRRGIPARHSGHGGARTYRRPPHVHGDIGRKIPSPSSAISPTTRCCCSKNR